MKGVAQHIIFGITVLILAVIIFVKAGQKGGASGGEQSSQLVKASGDAFSSGVTALEGGA